ncbi:hypothetical protein D3C78_1077670 [compost metagenome]
MEPRRTEGVLGHHPAWREDHEVEVGQAMNAGGRRQNGEDRWVRMVEAHGADGVETTQVVFVRDVVTVPGHDVERRMVQLAPPQFTEEFLYQGGRLPEIFVVRDRGQEVPRVGQAVAANRPQVRQTQRRAMVLGQVATCLRVEQFDTEFQATRQYRYFQRLQFQHAQLGDNTQTAQLRHQQPFAIGIEEHPLHGAIGAVMVNADAGRLFRARVGGHAHQAVDEISRLGGDVQRVPAQAVGRHFAQRTTGQLPLQLDERRVVGRRLNAVHPGTPRFAADHGECGAGEQFGVEAVRGFLRRVLADRQCARQRFTAEFVAEA